MNNWTVEDEAKLQLAKVVYEKCIEFYKDSYPSHMNKNIADDYVHLLQRKLEITLERNNALVAMLAISQS